MRRAILTALILVFAVLPLPSSAWAKRVAFVIGIDQYDNLDPAHQLKKAVNDAHAVGEALKTLGYDVLEADNVTRLDFVRQWQTFLNRIDPGDEAAFFFAGHGVEIGGLNFLLPRDVPQVASGEEQVLKSQGLSLSDFLDQVRERKPQVSLYVVDACRDNPFADANGRGIGGTRGLARVEPPSGTFVMFSAGAGETALDRLSDNDADPDSVYTRTLLPQLKAQGKSITEIAREVRREVRELASKANHVQTPAYYDEVVGDFCPAGCEAKVAAVEPSQVKAPPVPTVPAATPPQVAEASAPIADQKVAVVVPPEPPVTSPTAAQPVVATIPKPSAALPHKPGDTFKDCEQCPEMVVVPAGEFLMGSSPMEIASVKPEFSLADWESPQHKVTIAKPFAVGKFEVTIDQFESFVKDTAFAISGQCNFWTGEFKMQPGSFRSPGFDVTGRHPAVCLSYDDVKSYVAWLSSRTDKSYRLLTEAEWEYAARGVTTATPQPRYYFGNSEEDICSYANGADLTFKAKFSASLGTVAPCKDGYVFTAPVGSFKANAFGLHDMLGNVMEWVEGCGQLNYAGAPSDGSAEVSADCKTRINRGGTWHLGSVVQRSAIRALSSASNRGNILGFRVARTLNP
jgi:formylglycine-generating enzyme required for sulfatase activity